jgi:hypothetical protein
VCYVQAVSDSKDLLLVTIKPKGKEQFLTAIVLFCILQKYHTYNGFHVFRKLSEFLDPKIKNPSAVSTSKIRAPATLFSIIL